MIEPAGMTMTGPATERPFGIVGDGRVATHFSRYFRLLGIPFRQWSRRTPADSLTGCPVILLLVSDLAIEELASRYPDRTRVHFSGSFRSPEVHGMHPLMTFGHELYSLSEYQRIPFVAEDPAFFRRLFPALANPCYGIRADDKARYHALCAMAGNFTGFLWAKLFQEFPAVHGIPAEAAVPYLEQVCRNIAASPTRPESFLTGPIVRGDVPTVAKHLSALDGDPYRSVYEAFARIHMNSREVDAD
jgi:2-dehydropantoate 2-reductase